MKQHPLSDSLRDSFEAAQSQTAALEGTPLAWDRRRRGRGRRALAWALAGVIAFAIGASAWLYNRATNAPVAPADTPLAAAPRGARDAAPVARDPGQRFSVEPSPSVTVNGTVIDMAFSGTPLVDAARMLAAKTDTRVHGVEQLAGLGATGDFRWQGTGLANAWAVLLKDLPSKAISCKGAACDVWITAASAGATPPLRADPSSLQRPPSERAAWWATQQGSQKQPSGTRATQIPRQPAPSEKPGDDSPSD